MTLHWHSTTHDYSALLESDLFGGWVLVTTSGAAVGGGGRVRRKQVASYAEGLAALQRLRRRHRREGDALCGSAFAAFASLDPHGADTRAASGNALARVAQAWDVSLDELALLLAVAPRDVERYLDGQPLADDSRLLGRVADVLAIHKVLRLRYAGEAEIIRAWLRRPCDALGGAAPLGRLLESPQALAGLRRHLESRADAARGCVERNRAER